MTSAVSSMTTTTKPSEPQKRVYIRRVRKRKLGRQAPTLEQPLCDKTCTQIALATIIVLVGYIFSSSIYQPKQAYKVVLTPPEAVPPFTFLQLDESDWVEKCPGDFIYPFHEKKN